MDTIFLGVILDENLTWNIIPLMLQGNFLNQLELYISQALVFRILLYAHFTIP